MNLSPPRSLLAAVLAVVVLGVLPGVAAAASAPYVAPDDTGFNPPGAPSRFPSISGVPQVGGVLMGDRGAWSADVTLTSQWLRCSVAAKVCETTGDTDLSYTPPADAAGLVIRLRVVATRRLAGIAVGTRTEDAQSAPIAGIDPSAALSAPRNVTRPRIAGKVQEGKKLTGLPGEWAGSSPIGFSYGWFSCAGSGSCRSVSTSQSYTPAHADVGRKLILSVLALNPSGSSSLTVSSGRVAKKSALARLAPFPRLIIGGRVARSVTTISSFKLIRVPRGATIRAACSGRGCPFRKSTVKSGKHTTLRLKKLERRLRSGLMIVVTVRKGNTRLGKYTRLHTRRGAAPARVDRCVAPRSSKPISCG